VLRRTGAMATRSISSRRRSGALRSGARDRSKDPNSDGLLVASHAAGDDRSTETARRMTKFPDQGQAGCSPAGWAQDVVAGEAIWNQANIRLSATRHRRRASLP